MYNSFQYYYNDTLYDSNNNSQNKLIMKNFKYHQRVWLDRLNNHIDQHLHNSNFSVTYLAYLMNLSSASLYRKVIFLCECSPSIYIRTRRMEKAREMLETGRYTNLSQVAAKVGYTRKDYFIRCYQQAFSHQPEIC